MELRACVVSFTLANSDDRGLSCRCHIRYQIFKINEIVSNTKHKAHILNIHFEIIDHQMVLIMVSSTQTHNSPQESLF